MIKTTILGQKYLTLSWDETGDLTLQVAAKIIKSKQTFDRIVALGKGGLTWSRTLADYLAMDTLSTMQISFYTDVAKTNKKPKITQKLSVSVKGERILVFDDVADSGETLILAEKYLKKLGAKKVEAATLAIKTWTKYFPKYYALSSGAWIVFPHEIREVICSLKKNWTKKGWKDVQIKQNLKKIGVSDKEITLFYNLA